MSATFIISTGRCGTQWLTEKLRAMYPEWVICHEPLSFYYRPDLNTETAPLRCNEALLLQHAATIQGYLDSGQHYIETGFPCWRHLAWLKQQLHGNVRIIHLHREPKQTVHSLLKINAFVPPLLPHLPIKNLYLPTTEFGYLREWQHLWPTLNPAEKNLWYWVEVQARALQLQVEWPKEDWLQLNFAQLFSAQTEQQLIGFFGELQTNTQQHQPPGHTDIYGAGALVSWPVVFPQLKLLPQITTLLAQFDYSI